MLTYLLDDRGVAGVTRGWRWREQRVLPSGVYVRARRCPHARQQRLHHLRGFRSVDFSVYCSPYKLFVRGTRNIFPWAFKFIVFILAFRGLLQLRRTETKGHPSQISTDPERRKLPLYVYTGCKRNYTLCQLHRGSNVLCIWPSLRLTNSVFWAFISKTILWLWCPLCLLA